jgi:energy-coupling factor transport system substrate-specific component
VSSRLLALIPLAVAINVAIGRIVAELSLPVYLDAVGTILVSALAGLGAGVVTGLIGQVLTSFVSGYVWLAFAPIQILIALLAFVAARRGGFKNLGVSIAWGGLLGLVGGALSAVISYLAFKGVTAGGVTFVTTVLVGTGMELPWAITASSIVTDVLDKALAFALVGVALRSLPVRMISRYPLALRAVGR